MRSPFRKVSHMQQRHAHDAMPNHERNRLSLFRGERQKLRCKLARGTAIECHKVRYPEAVKDREQHQRVFGRLTQRFCSLDEQACQLDGRLGFRCGEAFGVHQSVCEGDLELDLLAAQGCGTRHGPNWVEGTCELSRRFDQRRARERPLSRFAPQARGFLD
jgi:hypothetical protein